MAPKAKDEGRGSLVWGFAAGLLVAAVLLATNGLVSCPITGTVMGTWPEPLGSIAHLLGVESWPTYDRTEVRWFAWALGAAGLAGLGAVRRPRQAASGKGATLFELLTCASLLLVGLVAIRAMFAPVPLMGLAWTWQVMLALLWMLALYAWTVRLSVRTLVRAMALSLSILSGISLLFCIQTHQSYPTWPTGNVLFLTSTCLAAVFLLGTWVYGGLAPAIRAGQRNFLTLAVLAGLLAMTVAVLLMAGRRGAVVGLAAGAIFIAIVTLWPGAAAGGAASTRRVRRIKLSMLAGGLLVLAAGGMAAPRMLRSGRWETVQFRLAMYKATASILREDPSVGLIGIGPGQMAFALTPLMRPLHAESPRLFHGEVFDHVHSEPLEAITELGLPVGLFYLALPLGGLIGFGMAYRSRDQQERLAILGGGAALAAVMAAEAISVAMRYAGVATLVWGLAGVGWACGAKAGGFERLARWFQPVNRALALRRTRFSDNAGIAAVCLVVLVAAGMAFRASGTLCQAMDAWRDNHQAEAEALFEECPCVPTSSAWMLWKTNQGRLALTLMYEAQDRPSQAAWEGKATDSLNALADACPAYGDTLALLARISDDSGRRRELFERLFQYDPYNQQGRLEQAAHLQAKPPEQLQAVRLAIRNDAVRQWAADLIRTSAKDAASQRLLSSWMEDARRAARQSEPARWPDPLALESLRIGIVVAAQEGKIAEAQELANQAAVLLKSLSADPWRRRLETVEMEVQLDQAWFGWLLQPQTASSWAEALQRHLQELGHGPVDGYSIEMAGQFAGMLWLSLDRPNEANRAFDFTKLRESVPVATLQGLGYARLAALMGSRAPADKSQTWADRGRSILGEGLWKQSLEACTSRNGEPWWLGVLRKEQ